MYLYMAKPNYDAIHQFGGGIRYFNINTYFIETTKILCGQLDVVDNLMFGVHRTSSCPQRIFVVSIQLLQLRRMSQHVLVGTKIKSKIVPAVISLVVGMEWTMHMIIIVGHADMQ